MFDLLSESLIFNVVSVVQQSSPSLPWTQYIIDALRNLELKGPLIIIAGSLSLFSFWRIAGGLDVP